MNDKLGVCVVGCGDMGTKHAHRWNQLPEARVVAVVDIIPERAQQLAQSCGLAQWRTDYRVAVALPDVDVVSVCVPTYLHPAVTMAAATHGKHVLCEKPIALTLEDADAMIATARQHRVKLGVGFMRSHSPILAALRAWRIANQRPVLYHAEDIRELRPKRAMHDTNANGGPIIDMAVHLFNVWSTMFDSQPISVSAQALRLAQGRPEIAHIQEVAYDTATINVRYASGDVGHFHVTWGTPPQVTPAPAPDAIYGSTGLLHVVWEMQHQEARLMREGGQWETIAACDEDMYQREIAAFADSVLNDTPFPANGEAGKAALRVSVAALAAIHTQQVVRLE